MDEKIDSDDVWARLPHISKKQFFWLAVLSWNGAGCGISYAFPVFGQYQPDFECFDQGLARMLNRMKCIFTAHY